MHFTLIAVIILCLTAGVAPATEAAPQEKAEPTSVLDFTLPLIDGTPKPLNEFNGQVLLLVNVASKCGFTGQYEGLQELYDSYKDKGFTVLGFPANNFLGQEPGSNDEIASFCKLTYGVTFPMFAKISVKGKDQHPLYKFLTDPETNPEHSGKISWNFNKFIVNRQGKVVARFGSMTKPQNAKLVAEIEKALNEN